MLQTGDQDFWSDPKGEFLAAVAAGPAYRLLDRQGRDTDQMPPASTLILHMITCCMRSGAFRRTRHHRFALGFTMCRTAERACRKGPTPYTTAETDRYCVGGIPPYVQFWKSWWVKTGSKLTP
jgi:hypothetical protein